MKVTTELKRLITERFQEIKDERCKALREEASAITDARIAEIENSQAWKNYVEASLKLHEYLEPDYNENSRTSAYIYKDLSFLRERDVKDLLWKNSSRYAEANTDISELNTKRDKLLIKLTYEKKLEKIEEMLAEYGITL